VAAGVADWPGPAGGEPVSRPGRLLVAAGLVVVGLGLLAGPAQAHAVLLRTEPAPQATLAGPPGVVRLQFSEAVEVDPGGIRVFDVDGRRVDRGGPARSDGDRTVTVPLARLAEGTYTVTFRAVSSDSHPVRGGFVFYVGRPSAVSAVPIDTEQAAPRWVEIGYGMVRFAWLAALSLLVGVVVVRRLVWTPTVRELGMGDSQIADQFRDRFARVLPAAWAVLAWSQLALLVFQAATVQGSGLVEAVRPAVLGAVLTSRFGRLWLAGLVLVAALLVPVAGLARRTRLVGVAPDVWIGVGGLLVAGLAVVAALSGHARTDPRPAIGVASLSVHLLAVAAWVGGLAALVGLAGPGWRAADPDDRMGLLRGLLVRFSFLGVVAVLVVTASGVVNATGQLASVSDLWRVGYGRVLTAKVALVAVALLLAARHRFVLPARLARPGPGAAAVARDFARSSAVELGVLAAVVALAAALVAMVPGRSVALAASGPINTSHRVGDYVVQLFIDPTAPGANEVHVTFTDPNGVAAGQVANATVTLATGQPPGAPVPLPVRLISPGHFVGDANLAAGRYRVAITSIVETSFDIAVRRRAPP